jgi:hypothetical protein
MKRSETLSVNLDDFTHGREAATSCAFHGRAPSGLAEEGKLPRTRIGGRTVVRRVDLEAFLASCAA